ncbi:hypothetical protein FRC00_013417 [Tulasnella sp. 408]|nr:hypothetical protein FRC00_013417 [Tulasnella sp. 408]
MFNKVMVAVGIKKKACAYCNAAPVHEGFDYCSKTCGTLAKSKASAPHASGPPGNAARSARGRGNGEGIPYNPPASAPSYPSNRDRDTDNRSRHLGPPRADYSRDRRYSDYSPRAPDSRRRRDYQSSDDEDLPDTPPSRIPDRARQQERQQGRQQDRGQDRQQDRGQDRQQGRYQERGQDRQQGRPQERGQDRQQGRYQERGQDRQQESYQERDQEKEHGRYQSQKFHEEDGDENFDNPEDTYRPPAPREPPSSRPSPAPKSSPGQTKTRQPSGLAYGSPWPSKTPQSKTPQPRPKPRELGPYDEPFQSD